MTTSSIILPTSLNLLSAQVITNVSEDITIDRQQWFMNPFCQKTTNLIYYEIFLARDEDVPNRRIRKSDEVTCSRR